MCDCNAIIEANNEIYRLKRENKKLTALCVKYGFNIGRLEEENEQLKQQLKTKVIINKQYEELQNLKNQIKIYELFLDQNDLNIEWDLFCTLNHCVNKEDTSCQTCKYMGLVDSDLDD